MPNEWIIDVLGDLRAFAADNDMPGLADQIDEALHVAAVETVQTAPGAALARTNDGSTGHLSGRAV